MVVVVCKIEIVVDGALVVDEVGLLVVVDAAEDVFPQAVSTAAAKNSNDIFSRDFKFRRPPTSCRA